MIGAILARRAVADAFKALNARDLGKFMVAWREDGTFEYPGDIPESGRFEGRLQVEGWFRRFFEHFPTIEFDVRDICVRNLGDLTGTNTVIAHWNIRLVNHEGREGWNSGVTVIDVVRGRVVAVKDYIFDLGDNFRKNWSALPAAHEVQPH